MAHGGVGCTESETGYNSLYSHHSRNYVESVSVEISSVMTRLGYGEEIRRWRAEKYREIDRLCNAQFRYETCITAGSKAEGLTCSYESDTDVLSVMKRVLCVEAGINLYTIPENIDVFKMDTRVYPGHCRLLQERPANVRYGVITNALCDDGYGDVLLSSSLYLDEISADAFNKFEHNPFVTYRERAGPSLPMSGYDTFHKDRVVALRCLYPSILQKWSARPRYWPPPIIVKKVVSLGAYVTPVGFRQSEYKHIEWRICFNTGEVELVNNLNDTQTKIYVILKMIIKDIMKPKNKEITSYLVKNIILWQAENTPQTEFHERSLLHWLHDGLRELRTAIEIKQLRYYMIPDRNLMAACGLGDALQHKRVADITEMLGEGPRVILRLPKIRKAIVASPEPMLWFSKRRMAVEMLDLLELKRKTQCRDQNLVVDDSDCILNAIHICSKEIYIELAARMLQEGSSVMSLFYLFNLLK